LLVSSSNLSSSTSAILSLDRGPGGTLFFGLAGLVSVLSAALKETESPLFFGEEGDAHSAAPFDMVAIVVQQRPDACRSFMESLSLPFGLELDSQNGIWLPRLLAVCLFRCEIRTDFDLFASDSAAGCLVFPSCS